MISIELFFTPVTEKKAEAEIYLFLTVFFLSTHTAYISHNATQTTSTSVRDSGMFCYFNLLQLSTARDISLKTVTMAGWVHPLVIVIVHTTFHYLIDVSVSA